MPVLNAVSAHASLFLNAPVGPSSIRNSESQRELCGHFQGSRWTVNCIISEEIIYGYNHPISSGTLVPTFRSSSREPWEQAHFEQKASRDLPTWLLDSLSISTLPFLDNQQIRTFSLLIPTPAQHSQGTRPWFPHDLSRTKLISHRRQ